MECPSCKTINSEDSQYCSKCGTPLKEIKDTLTHTPPTQLPQEDTLHFSPGENFGPRYQIIEEVGRGGMGRVYKAEDKELGITVALKMIHPEYSSRRHLIERFKKETLLARSISHENVIRIYDIGEVNRIKFISMDYIKGQSLKELILTSGTLSVDTAINITKQICEALKVACEKGVVHRDLKPQNILVDNSGKAYVTDFGVAKSVEVQEDSAPGIIIGTIQYLSPEQAKGEKADSRSDLYSLGIIMYEMLTGEKPFTAETYTGFLQKHLQEKPTPPSKINPNIPNYLEKIILKCLEKDKDHRYQNPGEIIRDLEEQKVAIPPVRRIEIKKSLKFIYAGVLIGLLIAVAFLWKGRQTLRMPTLPELPKKSLAVMHFENSTGDKSLDRWRRMIQELVIIDLHQSRHFEIIPNIQIAQILKDMNIPEEGFYPVEVLDKIASEKNVEYFILGSYAREGEDFWISARIIDARTHDYVGTEIVKAKGERHYQSLVDDLTLKLKHHFQLTASEIARDIDRNVEEITTSSPEALEYYVEGTKLHEEGKFEESIDVLKKAVDIDPDFALALINISDNYEYLGLYSEEQKYFQRALALLDRVSDRERYIIRGISMESPSKRLKNYHSLLKLYPDDELGYLSIGALYRHLEEWDQAVEWFKGVLKINNKHELAYKNLAITYMAKGLYEDAKNLIMENKHAFAQPSFHRYMCHIHLYQGQPDLALQEVRDVLSIEPDNAFNIELLGNIHQIRGKQSEARKAYLKLAEMDDPVAQSLGRFWLAHLHLLRGEYEKCEEEIIRGIALSREFDITHHEILFRIFMAHLSLRLENYQKALDASARAIETASGPDFPEQHKFALHLQGLAYAGMNRLDDADESAKQLKKLIRKTENKNHMRHYYHLIGVIELKEGKISKAVDHFEKAISLLYRQKSKYDEHAFFMDALALALYESGDVENAIPQLEDILSLSTGALQWGDIYATSLYFLGKACQKTGKTEEAVNHFRRFLELWKDADPGRPEVQDAKKQVDELSTARQ